MIVYRVENSEQEGPYFNSNQRWMVNNHNSSNLRPGIYYDGFTDYVCVVPGFLPDLSKVFIPHEDVCGFSCKSKLKTWFRKRELDILNEKGYYVNIYEIDDRYVLHGNSKKQIMFRKNKAELIEQNVKIY